MVIQINDTKQLVRVLTERRKSLGLSQDELATLCNLSINGISKFESNAGEREIKLSTLFKLSQILGFKIALELED
ncbi:MAG: helix-turn-helix transcriptional regulator [Bdellovibrionota bacterium]